MKNKGFGHLKTRLFTIKTSKNVGLGGPWIIKGPFERMELLQPSRLDNLHASQVQETFLRRKERFLQAKNENLLFVRVVNGTQDFFQKGKMDDLKWGMSRDVRLEALEIV